MCWPRPIPNCVSYDPTFAYEVAVIIQDGLRRMFAEQEDVFYYLTADERELRAPGDAGGRRGRDPQGHVPAARGGEGAEGEGPRVQLLGSGTILREVHRRGRAARQGLRRGGRHLERPSFTELRRDGLDAERWNLLHPTETPRRAYVDAVPRRARRAR